MKKELAINSEIRLNDLKDVPYYSTGQEPKEPMLIFDIDDSIAKVEISELSKYEKIRLKKKLEELKERKEDPESSANEYYLYGLSDLVSNGKFIDELMAISKAERIKANESIDEADQKKSNEGFDNIVLVDPYLVYHSFKNEENFEQAEQNKIEVANLLSQNYPKLELNTTLIDSKQLNEENVAQYNEIGLIFQWMQEIVEHDEIGMISSSNDLMENVEEKYGTEHFVFTGFFGYKARKEPTSWRLAGLAFFPLIPFVILNLVIVQDNLQIVTVSVNSSTDQIEFSSSEDFAMYGSPKVIEVYIYDLLYRLKNNQ
jgi:hypothetical protein